MRVLRWKYLWNKLEIQSLSQVWIFAILMNLGKVKWKEKKKDDLMG